MAKEDRQAERLDHVSGGGKLASTHYGQTPGTVKATDNKSTRSTKSKGR